MNLKKECVLYFFPLNVLLSNLTRSSCGTEGAGLAECKPEDSSVQTETNVLDHTGACRVEGERLETDNISSKKARHVKGRRSNKLETNCSDQRGSSELWLTNDTIYIYIYILLYFN